MSITRRDIAAAGALALGAAAFPSLASAQAGDEAAVNQAVEAMRRAMIDANREQLDALAHDALSYGHSAGAVENKQQFIDVIASRRTVYKSISLTNPSSAVVGNNAIVRHIFSAEVESGGSQTRPRIGVLMVWVKDGGNWRLLARQAHAVPPA